MKLKLLIPTITTALFLSNSITYAGDIQKMNQTEEDVYSTIENMTEAFHKGDIKGVMGSYETQATVVFEPNKPASDMDQIRQMFEGAFQVNPEFTYAGHDVFVSGDIALHIAPWQMKGKAPDGTEIAQSGLSVAVLRKQPDGSWRMVIDNPHGQILMENK